MLGNTPAVCRKCYVHPAIPEAYRSGELHEAWRRSRATATMERKDAWCSTCSNDERPDTVGP